MPATTVNVLDRAVSLLQAFSVSQPRMSLAELSRATGLHRSTALRLLGTLVQAGLVQRDPGTGHYALGYETIALAETARAGTGLMDLARPVMQDISAQLDETAVLSVRSGDHRVDLDQVVAAQPIRRVVSLGQHKLLTFGAPSLALICHDTPDALAGLLTRQQDATLARHPDFSAEALALDLAQLRSDGFYEQRRQYGPGSYSGSVGIAGPVRDRHGSVACAFGVTAPASRVTPDLRDRMIAAVLDGCRAISARLGGTQHDD
ncbi:IclR family transcriptional regulator [Pseudoprimorskyibacter insulae]|uniref:DNA-binding transcriptional repressor YiaJ n=1 Tax=Pseudoprimorskyibacter insulae TaxID=1695997 RepID=A0A2R8AQ30_9RHOB|nr:IclR family transcriptional regulator [Pseudoprimorskyibacter insulae]SPF78125.1 DNA-binding transcriptional repressor YiaJ [Pseudoprimorskyibacter insulae]